MKRLSRGIAAAIASFFFFSGCQEKSDLPARPTPQATVEYTGQALQGEVFNLKGTPLYSESEKLAKKISVEGAPFLLLASKDPSLALLVVVTDTTPGELVSRKSELKDFSGNTESRDAPELISHVKAEYALNLKTDESGKLLILKVSSPPPTAGATPSGEKS